MGVVHEAWDTRLERRVALKMVHPHLLADPAVSERFEKEAKRAARIEHPNVVRVYRVDTFDGRVAIEMQYIDGTPLNVLLRSGPIPPRDAVDLLRQVLEALIACHEQGVIHCDLKPGNLLVTRNGHVMLTDFGIARALYDSGALGPSAASTSAPITSPMWGTPQYCPPEAWEGGAIAPQWDLYAAGALIYEAIAGAPPFRGPTLAALMKAILTTTPPPLKTVVPETSEALSDLVASMLAPDPSARPANARAALTTLCTTPELEGRAPDTLAIRSYAQTDPPMRVDSPRPEVVTPRRRPALFASLIGLTLVCAAIAGYVTFPSSDAQPTTPILVTQDPKASDLLVVKNTAYFVADDGIHGYELWCSDIGAGNTCTLAADIATGSVSSNPRHFLIRDAGGFVFTADSTEAGAELYFCDGPGVRSTTARLIKDIVPGPRGSNPEAIASDRDTVLFFATNASVGRELWRSNGIDADQTVMVADTYRGVESAAGSRRVCETSDGAYLVLQKDVLRGSMLYYFNYSDGSLREIADVGEHTASMALVPPHVLFANSRDAEGYELWSFQEGSQAIELVHDIWPGPHSSDPSEFFSMGGYAVFKARTPEAGAELWVARGNPVETDQIFDINPGAGDGDPYGFVLAADHIFFRAKDDKHGRELWVTDGTERGTTLVADVLPGPDSGEPYNLVAGPSYILFTANDGVHGEELWVARLVNKKWQANIVIDLFPGPLGSEPHHLQWTQDNRAFFLAKTPNAGETLCALFPGPDLEGTVLEGAQPTRVETFRLLRNDSL